MEEKNLASRLRELSWEKTGEPHPSCPMCGYPYNIGILDENGKFDCRACGTKFTIDNIEEVLREVGEDW